MPSIRSGSGPWLWRAQDDVLAAVRKGYRAPPAPPLERGPVLSDAARRTERRRAAWRRNLTVRRANPPR